jgi:hypothetical protein
MKPNALRAMADAADAFARLARAAADDQTDPDDALIPIRDAARLSAASVRALRRAIRAGALPVYGRTRNRAVRRGDVLAWIAERRAPVLSAPDDDDVERRMRRLARARRLPAGPPAARRLPPRAELGVRLPRERS